DESNPRPRRERFASLHGLPVVLSPSRPAQSAAETLRFCRPYPNRGALSFVRRGFFACQLAMHARNNRDSSRMVRRAPRARGAVTETTLFCSRLQPLAARWLIARNARQLFKCSRWRQPSLLRLERIAVSL